MHDSVMHVATNSLPTIVTTRRVTSSVCYTDYNAPDECPGSCGIPSAVYQLTENSYSGVVLTEYFLFSGC
jgi:hypothetical protein